MLIPLHVKSHYSLGHGVTSIERLVERASMLGLPALALTDRENFCGQVLFHKLAHARGLQPITGVEVCAGVDATGAESTTRLVLLARNRSGYENLSRLITRRKLAEHALSIEQILPELAEGIFILANDPGWVEALLAQGIVDSSWVRFLLIRPPPRGHGVTHEERLFEVSRRLGVPLVADADIDFLDPQDREVHRLAVAIGRNLLVTQVDTQGLVATVGRHFPGPRENEHLFADVPEAVEETQRIAAACQLDLRRTTPIFPRIPLPEGETAYSHLAKLAFRGLETRRRQLRPQDVARLSRELGVIEKLGFCEYFLVVGNIVQFAREQRIEVVGRGSGAGSIVAYALGVTNVDPIEHRLYFERFLHEGRSDLPDIDIDICWIRRDEVIEHVYRTYGADRVAMISTHVTFQPHLAFREALKAYGAPLDHVNHFSRLIPYLHPQVESTTPLRELIASSPIAREIPLHEEPFRTALPLAERLLNLPHHLSIHPGGIVIGDRAIDAYTPLERAAKGFVVTQYDMYSIEDVGLVKIDLLGNRCLTELQETLEWKRRDGLELNLADIPDADPGTIALLQSAQTIGCFQLESPAMRSLLAKLRVQRIRDVIAAVAIIRPGAAAGGAKEAYIRRSRGEENPSYLHPSLRKILEEAYGVVIYEEDVMCIASEIAGISLAEGDTIRSAIKKHRHPDDLRDVENTFLRRAVHNKIEPDVALAVWQDLKKFASYCFSKAHASGYGVLAYQSAYMKVHYPVQLGCALLNNHAGMYSTRTIAEEVKRLGVRLLSPSVNRSVERFTVEPLCSPARPPSPPSNNQAIRIGLGRIKGLALDSIAAILAARESDGPFQSLGEFLRRVLIQRRETEALVLAGAFDDLPPPHRQSTPLNHPQLLWELESSGKASAGAGVGTPGWFDLGPSGLDYPPLPPYSPLERLQQELEVLELAVAEHPLRLLREEASRRGAVSTQEAAQATGKRVRVAGLLAATRSVRTQKGDTMQFLTLEDEHGLLEATLFPQAHRAYSSRLRTLGPYLVEGKVEEDHGAVNLNVARLERW